MGTIRSQMTANIERVINAGNMSKRDIAKKLGISQAAISNWIAGKNCPDLETLVRFCDLFEISLDDIYSAEPIRTEQRHYQDELISNYSKLNFTGKMKLLDFSEDLVASGRYDSFRLCDESAQSD